MSAIIYGYLKSENVNFVHVLLRTYLRVLCVKTICDRWLIPENNELETCSKTTDVFSTFQDISFFTERYRYFVSTISCTISGALFFQVHTKRSLAWGWTAFESFMKIG